MQEGVISTENAVIAETVKDGDLVRPFDTVKVYATKKAAPFMKEGEEVTVHPLLAKKLIDSGKATNKKATGKSKDELKEEEPA